MEENLKFPNRFKQTNKSSNRNREYNIGQK